MKRLFAQCLPLFALVSVVFTFALPAQAHILKTDGDVSVMLHANPDDEPYAGVPTSLLFFISDASVKFTPAACDCEVHVADPSGTEIFSGAMQLSNGDVGTVTVTFPKEAVYTVRLDGNPKTPGAFQPFSVSYDERVDRTAAPPPAAKAAPFWPIVLALVLGISALYLLLQR